MIGLVAEASRRSLGMQQLKRYRWVLLLVALLVGLGLLPSTSGPAKRYVVEYLPSKLHVSNGLEHIIPPVKPGRADFHLIIPATSSNKHLCRLLLSVAALGYPSPIFINYGAVENADPYVQHIAKVGGILDYLSKFSEERDNDLVLILDGYDVFLQLRPDVVIKRYYEVIDTGNKRLLDRMGLDVMRKHGIYQSVVFGPDKVCWPEDPRRPACWAVPESTLPQYVFGPDTDTGRWREYYRPRWLNSGTIIGPVADIRKVLGATLEKIHQNGTILSDQYHLSNLWAEQEYARTVVAEGPIINATRREWFHDDWQGRGHFETVELELPRVPDGQETEYHITIDYESKLFQTMSYYWRYLGWVHYDDSHRKGQLVNENIPLGMPNRQLPEDVLSSPPPFAAAAATQPTKRDLADPTRDAYPVDLDIPSAGYSWQDMTLGTNLATGQIFPLIHFTPPKEYRDKWYHRMWYFPYGEAIIKGTRPDSPRGPYVKTADGREWWDYNIEDSREATERRSVGGGFDDKDAWHSWNSLCEIHEDAVFRNQVEEGHSDLDTPTAPTVPMSHEKAGGI